MEPERIKVKHPSRDYHPTSVDSVSVSASLRAIVPASVPPSEGNDHALEFLADIGASPNDSLIS